MGYDHKQYLARYFQKNKLSVVQVSSFITITIKIRILNTAQVMDQIRSKDSL